MTIDYGPYGWLEPFEPGWTPNTTDFGQYRYAFGRQPTIAQWNLMMLARALSPLVTEPKDLNRGLERYRATFTQTYDEQISRKLGLSSLPDVDDKPLIELLNQSLFESQMDMTVFFRHLAHVAAEVAFHGRNEHLFQKLIKNATYASPDSGQHENLLSWLNQYATRLGKESRDAYSIRDEMLRANPKYVLRNYLAQEAIDGADMGDLSALETLFKVLRTPFDEHPEHEILAAKRPDWASDKPGCATLSCSS